MSSSGGHSDHSHGGVGKYMMVFLALCGLTTLSFFTYSRFWPFQETPVVGWVFMMAVSCTKAMLVICFFMHLIWEANWKYVLTIPASLMSVFLVVALVPDVGQRTRYYAEERSLYASDYEADENLPLVESGADASSESGASGGSGTSGDSNEANGGGPSKDAAGATDGSAGDAAAKADST